MSKLSYTMPLGSSKPVFWMGNSQERLRDFPEDVKGEIGYALYLAQCGDVHISAKRMTGINAVEIVSDYDTDTFRGVYTTKLEGIIYVLHCFQKKSKKGSKTPKPDLDLIKIRLKAAEKLHKEQKEPK